MFNHFQRYKNIPSDKKNPPPNGRFPAFHDNFCNKMFLIISLEMETLLSEKAE